MGVSDTSFIKSIFKFSISSWVNFFISILSVIITTRIFSPEMYGSINMYNSASSLFMGIICLGLDSGFLRFYNEPPKGYDEKQLMAKCMSLPVLFLLGIIVFVVPFFYKDISVLLFGKVSLLAVILLCINTMSLAILNFFSIAYRISNDARRYTIQSILVQFFTKIFVITAALFNPKLETVIIFNTIGVFVLSIIYFKIQKKSVLPSKINWSMQGFSEVFKYAIFSWPTVILIYLNSFFPQMIIKNNLGDYELGIYSSTAFFVGALGVVLNGFKTYWASFMYANYKTERSKIIKIHDYVVLLVVFILSFFIVFQNLLYGLIGIKFHQSRYFFTLVLVYPLFNLISETTSYGISIAKKSQTTLGIFLLSTAVNLVFGCIFVNCFGTVGVAIASMLSAFVQLVISTIIGQKYYRTIKDPRRTFISILLILVLACSNYFFAEEYIFELFAVFILNAIIIIGYRQELSDIISLSTAFINKYKRPKV
ncbi:lipopolysaccharide biosynthesis protein [Acetivibrio clariflavus]|uniref:Membrane protein involved in the export of O-antigen and teichoic acid n=1 Tax=Acetivibrio clariflavus (strain DSM 19732 / NBRC 101661 / EBR45) TaxID=720554 RepID=G8LUG7_ACECE|nr:oligosaccharide flippase family protein [Acetivibrio clariflavus]AEV70615.1 membrane protein involved in the export of O-antigen and teichoic acid [Acetivibrio clariflavus DSM 19732]